MKDKTKVFIVMDMQTASIQAAFTQAVDADDCIDYLTDQDLVKLSYKT